MTWVLILVLTVPHGSAITTHEFLSQEACQNAGKEFVRTASSGWTLISATYVCTPKDVLSPIR